MKEKEYYTWFICIRISFKTLIPLRSLHHLTGEGIHSCLFNKFTHSLSLSFDSQGYSSFIMLYLTLAILFYIHKIVRCFRRCEICHVFLVGPRDWETRNEIKRDNLQMFAAICVALQDTHTHRYREMCVCVLYTCRAVLRWPYLAYRRPSINACPRPPQCLTVSIQSVSH